MDNHDDIQNQHFFKCNSFIICDVKEKTFLLFRTLKLKMIGKYFQFFFLYVTLTKHKKIFTCDCKQKKNKNERQQTNAKKNNFRNKSMTISNFA